MIKIKRIVLIVGGLFQAFASYVHVQLFFKTAALKPPVGVPASFFEQSRWDIFLFNAMVTVTLVFFALASLFLSKEMIGTRIGRLFSWLVALFYLSAVVVSTLHSGTMRGKVLYPVIILYIFTAWPNKKFSNG